ncbi:carboxylesterase family protein [Rubripirellula lacrimiformis]|uniref:carboxylesterase family protein n=1 Tax=Rubripirellula lacrimiformis TaxID=1930273 RepID=UPI001C54E7BC|nr:alpha/beta hydrolase-fold protein [Rubripirellula lacrimiformis]
MAVVALLLSVAGTAVAQTVPDQVPGQVLEAGKAVAVTTTAANPAAANPADAFTAATFDGLPYRLLAPESTGDDGTADADAKYPLVLFLHGAGERGNDNVAQLKHGAAEFLRPDRRQAYPAYVVMPQCPKDARWVESDWGTASGDGAFPQAPSGPMAKALALVDHLADTLPVDPNRIYVTGLSMGGQGTWYAAVAPPKRFAAMLEVCGGGDPSWAHRYDGVPVWAFHGQSDSVVPVLRGREMIKALAQSGHYPELRYTEYPGVGHDSWTRTYSRDDVFDWLFRQSKN